MTTVMMIVTLTWPAIVEQVMGTAVQYIDTAMVGSLGTQATAAVGSTSTVGWLIHGTISSFGVGFLAIIARVCGAGDRPAVRRAVSQAVLVVLVIGTACTVFVPALSGVVPVWMRVDENIRQLASAYFFILYLPMLPRTATMIFGTVLRAAGDTKTPMRVGVIVNMINVVLNYLLIYPTRAVSVGTLQFMMPGAGMGIIGAAVASAIAYTWGGIHITIVMWKHPMVSPKGIRLRPDRDILRPCVKIAFPNMMQQFGVSLGFVLFASMINSLGDVSTATHTIANTVESAFYIPCYGMRTAIATLVGNAYGASDSRRMKSLAAVAISIETALMILCGAALFFCAPFLMGIFSRSSEVIGLGSSVLRMVAVSEPFYGFTIIVEGMMMGVGETKKPFLFNIIGMWCVRIAGAFVCTQMLGMGLISAWACMIGHNVLLFVLYLVIYIRGTWNPLYVRELRERAAVSK